MSIVAGPVGDEVTKNDIIETIGTDLGTDKNTDAAVAMATEHADCGCKKSNRKTILFILLILLIAGAIVWYFKSQNPA